MNTNSLKTYIGLIAAFPRISRQEEIDLANLIAKGSQSARETLTVCNLKLVVKIAHSFKNLGIPLNDLVAEGNVGLMKAVEKFRPNKGAKFSSYAAWWIKQAIRRALSNQSRMIRIPVQSASRIRQINQLKAILIEKLGRPPTEKEIAKELKVSVRSVHALLTCAKDPTISLNSTLRSDEKGTLEDIIPDFANLPPDQSLNKEQLKCMLEKIIDEELTERERTIINMRYGFDNGLTKTLEEVSQTVGKTRERVRQIQHEALRKIKLHMKELNLFNNAAAI